MEGRLQVTEATLQGAVGSEVALELDPGHEDAKPYAALDVRARAQFDARLDKAVADGLLGKRDSLAARLAASPRARDVFGQTVARVRVVLAPPARVRKAALNVNADWDGAGTLTLALKTAAVAAGTAFEGFGADVDAAMGLCALTDGYVDKARGIVAQAAAAAMQCQALGQTECDFSFTTHPNYVKLDETSRCTLVANVANYVKDGLSDRKLGLATHLGRSRRAGATFAAMADHIEFFVDGDNRCKSPLELQDGAGVLRIMVRLSDVLKNKSGGGWGHVVDAHLGLRVEDEMGMRSVLEACGIEASQLPAGTVIDVDWSFTAHDRWVRMKETEKEAFYTNFAKKFVSNGVKDLAKLLGSSARSWQMFAETVSCVRIAPQCSGAVKPSLGAEGVLVLPMLTTDIVKAAPWGKQADEALGLRIDEEKALVKAQATLDKMGCGGLAIVVDWSFLDDPTILRGKVEKRLGMISNMVSWIKSGVGGRKGLSAEAGTLAGLGATTLLVRPGQVRSKPGVELRLSDSGILEATVKQTVISGAGSPPGDSWLPLWSGQVDGGDCDVPEYHLLARGDAQAACALDPPSSLPNPLLDDDGGDGGQDSGTPYDAPPGGACLTTSTGRDASAPSLAEVKPVVPKKVAAPPPTPVVATRAATPKSAPAAAPVVSVPGDWACDVTWSTCCKAMNALRITPEIDWSFVEHAKFVGLPDDKQRKTVCTNIGTRVFVPLEKELSQLSKQHALYADGVGAIRRVRFSYDPDEKVMDTLGGRQGKTHYRVAFDNDGETLEIVENLSAHMTGTLPQLQDKLRVLFGAEPYVLHEKVQQEVALAAQRMQLEGFVDPTYLKHEAFLLEPVTADSLKHYAKVCKEMGASAGKLITSLEQACRDAIFNAAFKSRFTSLLVRCDCDNGVRDPTTPSGWALENNAEENQVVLVYNLRDGAQAGQAAPNKLKLFIDVRLDQAIEAAVRDANAQIAKWRGVAPTTVVELDQSWMGAEGLGALPTDKALEACKHLKPWMAGVLRQLGLVVTKSAAVWKDKVKTVLLALDPTNSAGTANAPCLVLWDEAGGLMRLTQNLSGCSKPDPGISQRVDGVLDASMAVLGTQVEAELATRSRALAVSLGQPEITVGLDFASFERADDFKDLLPIKKEQYVKHMRRHLESVLEALVKCGPSAVGPEGSLVAVLFSCDDSNSQHDPLTGATDAENYSICINPDRVMHVRLNLNSVEGRSLGRVHHKVENQLALHRARLDETYHTSGPECFDWESLQGCSQLINDQILAHFESSLETCKETTRTFSKSIDNSRNGSPAGKAALDCIEKFLVRMDRHQGPSWRILLEDDRKTLVLQVSEDYVRDKSATSELEWKEELEWVLGSTVEVEKYHALALVSDAEKSLHDAFSSAIPVSIDWAVFIDTPDFLQLGPDGCRDHIRALSQRLLANLVSGACSIARHPVGEAALRQRCTSIRLVYGPDVEMRQRLKEPCRIIVEADGTLVVTFRDLMAACKSDYKARIEFELGIVVSVAEHDAGARRLAVEKQLGIPVEYKLLPWTETDEFRFGVDIADQPRVVDAVVAGLAERAWGRSEDSLLSLMQRSDVKERVKRVCITLSTNADDKPMHTFHGRLDFEDDGLLLLTCDLGTVLAALDQSHGWRPRIAWTIGVLEALARDEADARLARVEKELGNDSLHLRIDFSFQEEDAWKSLACGDRYERVLSLGGELARDALLGYWGIPGLTEWPEVRDAFCNRIQTIELAVDVGRSGLYQVEEGDAGVLRLVFGADETRLWSNTNSTGCRARVEQCLGLRPLVEKTVCAEQDRLHLQPASQELGKPLTVDWPGLMAQDEYKEQRDYVAYLRDVGQSIPPLVLGWGDDDEKEGLPWLKTKEPVCVAAYESIVGVHVEVDGSCTVRPQQDRFVNGNMEARLGDGGSLILRVRRDFRTNDGKPGAYGRHRGCGAVVRWLLAPGPAGDQERERVNDYERKLMMREEERRADEIRYWEQKCRDNTDRYNREMQRYAQAGSEKCNSCRGRGYWGVKLNHKCSSCKTTGFKQASMSVPKMPSQPSQPTFPSMGSTDWTGLALKKTAFKVVGRCDYEAPDQGVPKSPSFGNRPCPRYSKNKTDSVGAEQPRPAGVPGIAGWRPYVPLEESEDPWGTPAVFKGLKKSAKASTSSSSSSSSSSSNSSSSATPSTAAPPSKASSPLPPVTASKRASLPSSRRPSLPPASRRSPSPPPSSSSPAPPPSSSSPSTASRRPSRPSPPAGRAPGGASPPPVSPAAAAARERIAAKRAAMAAAKKK